MVYDYLVRKIEINRGLSLLSPLLSPQDAKKYFYPRDPIILDLDGNGIQTVGLNADIHFDFDSDGVLTQTGWVGAGDGLLILDRNANDAIDNGSELFGDYTPITRSSTTTNADGSVTTTSTTTYAPNGFAALASLDSNNDGMIDANDPAFAQLKLWRDTNQDGVSNTTGNTSELISLSEAGIVSLNLTNILKNQTQTNGNLLTREGSFTKIDATTGQTLTQTMSEYNLATNTFDTQFKDNITISDTAKTLPNMQGSGNVRELQQAATQSSALQSLLSQFSATTTRAAQKELLNQVLLAWADTSGMAKSLEARADGKFNIQYDAFGNERRSSNIKPSVFNTTMSGGTGTSTGNGTGSGGAGSAVISSSLDNSYLTDKYQALIAEWTNKLHVLEAFNGQYFFNLPDTKSQTAGANIGITTTAGSGSSSGSATVGIVSTPTLSIQFAQQQLNLLNQAYNSLTESIYGALVLQTRLKPYLDLVNLVIDNNGIHLDATALNNNLASKTQTDPLNALSDMLDLDKYAKNLLASTNWEGLASFDTLYDSLPKTPALTALLNEFSIKNLNIVDATTGLPVANDDWRLVA